MTHKEMAQIRAKQMKKEAEQKCINKLDDLGFDYLGGYAGRSSTIKLKCRSCGEVLERNSESLRHKDDRVTCPTCRHKDITKREEHRKADAQKKKQEREALRLIVNPLGLSPYQLEREKELDNPHACKICGKVYTIREYIADTGLKYKRASGYCSAKCRQKAKTKRERERRRLTGSRNEKHYSRARRLGLPRERGITLKKLIERDGLQCAICGLFCIYGGDPKSDLYPSIDHIVPMARGGGHVWNNVQVAHRRCNSVKADRVQDDAGNFVRIAQKGGA